LLDALNKSEGNILDNNALISTLETLKKEAAAIAVEVEKTEDVRDRDSIQLVPTSLKHDITHLLYTRFNVTDQLLVPTLIAALHGLHIRCTTFK
jgi:hypothetical protein